MQVLINSCRSISASDVNSASPEFTANDVGLLVPEGKCGPDKDYPDSDYEASGYPHMTREADRLKTLHAWPTLAPVNAADLAKDGFYYIGPGDRVQCTFCRRVIHSWSPGDRVHDEHKRISPSCPFLRGREVGNVPLYKNLQSPLNVYAAGHLSKMAVGSTHPSRESSKPRNRSGKTEKTASPFMSASSGTAETSLEGASAMYIPGTSSSHSQFAAEEQPQQICVVPSGVSSFQTSISPTEVRRKSIQVTREIYPHSCPLKPSQPGAHELERLQMSDELRVDLEQQVMAAMNSSAVKAVLKLWPMEVVKPIVIRLVREDQELPSAEKVANILMDTNAEKLPLRQANLSWLPQPRDTNMGQVNESFQAISSTNEQSPTHLSSLPAQNNESTGVLFSHVVTPSPSESLSLSPSFVDHSLSSVEERTEALVCKVCMERQMAVTFVPCGHLVCCEVCALRLDECPLCRCHINKSVRTYL